MITPLSKECLFIFSISLSVYSIVISLSSTKVHIIFHICKSVTIILSSLNGTYGTYVTCLYVTHKTPSIWTLILAPIKGK
jgi:hypothetical protein